MKEDSTASSPTCDDPHFLFRRQFVLGPRAFHPNEHWITRDVRPGLTLSTHADLEVTEARSGPRRVTVAGCAVDPLHPERTAYDVARDIADNAPTLADAIRRTCPLTGRWLLIYADDQAVGIVPDAFGARRVFYHAGPDGAWCGSDPRIIAANDPTSADTDPELLAFVDSAAFHQAESAWVGEGTRRRDCRHLLPNHYLDLWSGTSVRFFPEGALEPLSVDEAAGRASRLLRGSLEALVRRAPLMLAVTAGWDSRVLLAAAREHVDSIRLFVDRRGVLGDDHPDIAVPRALSKRLGFPFVVESSSEEPPKAFGDLISRNVDDARSLPKTRGIYAKWLRSELRANVNGNGSEVCRAYFDPSGSVDRRAMTAGRLGEVLGYPGVPFVERALAEWLADLPADLGGIDLLDLLYWEQRMGNWGTLYAAEQDVAVEEVSPFDNRLLLTTMLAAPREARLPPGFSLYRRIIDELWPATMKFPVNPPRPWPRPSVARRVLRRIRRARPPWR